MKICFPDGLSKAYQDVLLIDKKAQTTPSSMPQRAALTGTKHTIKQGSTVTDSQKVLIDKFETAVSKLYYGELKFHQIDSEYTDETGRKTRRAIFNDQVYFTYEVGKEHELISHVEEIVRWLNSPSSKFIIF